MFAHTLRHLDIWNARGTEPQILYIICQFPLLEDLSIGPLAGINEHPGDPVPTITRSPPLRGKLVLEKGYSREFHEGLAAFPGGLNFRSLELTQCSDSQVVLAACSRTVTSISYLWYTSWNDGTIPLDLKQSAVLERFEFTIWWYRFSLPQVDGWLLGTLRTITSPMFNEFVISILYMVSSQYLQFNTRDNGWDAVDAWLNVIAERNPDFRVVVRCDPPRLANSLVDKRGARAILRSLETSLPLVSSKGLVTVERWSTHPV